MKILKKKFKLLPLIKSGHFFLLLLFHLLVPVYKNFIFTSRQIEYNVVCVEDHPKESPLPAGEFESWNVESWYELEDNKI